VPSTDQSAPTVIFLTDYGLRDPFVGICHGVITRICPEARIIDLSHGVPRHDVQAGALMLASALPYMPPGVVLGVVDPDVGAARRAVAFRGADGRTYVGPDNGLLRLAADASGGVVEAVDIAHSPLRLQPVAATFHGRDIFAPVAAHLVAGTPLADAGSPLDPAGLVRLELPRPAFDGPAIVAHVLAVDTFGNAALDLRHDDLDGRGIRIGRTVAVIGPRSAPGGEPAAVVRTFADASPGELILYEDADRRVAIAISRGSAADRLGLDRGIEVRIVAA
jgi:S-adenosylmethionine hydrolase